MDLRVPSGLLFLIIGLILTGMGVIYPDLKPALITTNVNLYCGLSMLIFGAFLLLLARAKRA
jgi:hypothetical protein